MNTNTNTKKNTVSINDKQIVSVAVITYHSAATVLETLESIVDQSYGPENIELIISDDGSKDNTVQVINEWLALHQTKFHCVKFFANFINGGISKNCNVAWKAATSSWIKTIAGDDILLPNCIMENINYVSFIKNDDSVGVICSLMHSFVVDENGVKVLGDELPCRAYHDFFSLSAEKQNNYLKVHGVPIAPSAFLNNSFLRAVGYADERFKLMEDYPLWLKITKNNCVIRFFNTPTVLYRKAESVSHTSAKLINEKFLHEIIYVESELVIPELSSRNTILKIRKSIWPRIVLFVSRKFDNKPTAISKVAISFTYLLKPGFLLFQYKKILILINSFLFFKK